MPNFEHRAAIGTEILRAATRDNQEPDSAISQFLGEIIQRRVGVCYNEIIQHDYQRKAGRYYKAWWSQVVQRSCHIHSTCSTDLHSNTVLNAFLGAAINSGGFMVSENEKLLERTTRQTLSAKGLRILQTNDALRLISGGLMRYASTFLSHCSVNKELVVEVSRELARRGVVSWLDKNELVPGMDMPAAFERAINEQATLTVFLSEDAIESNWVNDEIKVALNLANTRGEIVLPIFLGKKELLVKANDILRDKWIEPDGRITTLGIQTSIAPEIAEYIAGAVYKALRLSESPEVAVFIDQRGDGSRTGRLAALPDILRWLDIPTLVFRPDVGERRRHEVISGSEWLAFQEVLTQSLARAFPAGAGGTLPRKIFLIGSSQLSIPFLLGQFFSRETNTTLHCYNHQRQEFENAEPLSRRGLGTREEHSIGTLRLVEDDARTTHAISVMLVSEHQLAEALEHLAAHPELPRSVLEITHGDFTGGTDVIDYIASVVSTLEVIRHQHQIRRIVIYCSLPFYVLPMLSAELPRIAAVDCFVEYDAITDTFQQLEIRTQ